MANINAGAGHGKTSGPLTEALAAHTSAQRLDTASIVTRVLKETYPDYHLTTTPQSTTDLLGFASSGHAKATPIEKEDWLSTWTVKGALRHPAFAHRMVGDDSAPPEQNKEGPELHEKLGYGSFKYEWDGHEFILFVIEGQSCGICRAEAANYLLSKESNTGDADNEPLAHSLMKRVAEWMMQIGESVLVFDQGRWRKDTNLWKITKFADWGKVVLSEDTKTSLRSDAEGFFESEDLYKSFSMPWKRGTIFHGPPGNGKTLVIQTLMRSLSSRPEPIPTLYVKTFVAERGPQWSVSQIFSRARATAPCMLVFEDIDSMVTEKLRSYFLNEVDGLESNDGIYMLGTTNHLDRLDPSLSQRPSRFDRKIPFQEPSREERVMYAKQWKKKVSNLGDAEFPEALCEDIADATEGFSFAYMKELFVATFLGIAREGINPRDLSRSPDVASEGKLSEEVVGTVLRPRIMVQVETLRVAIAGAAAKEKEKDAKKIAMKVAVGKDASDDDD